MLLDTVPDTVLRVSQNPWLNLGNNDAAFAPTNVVQYSNHYNYFVSFSAPESFNDVLFPTPANTNYEAQLKEEQEETNSRHLYIDPAVVELFNINEKELIKFKL